MNGKQAKKLRRIAMGLATTLDQAGNKISKGGYELEKHTEPDPSSIMSNSTSMRKTSHPPVVKAVTIHNKRNSLRGIYRTIKKGVASGKIDP